MPDLTEEGQPPLPDVDDHPDEDGLRNKPFCDGTHLTIDFDGTLAN